MGKSEIEEICTKIYKKHQQALDLIFQYKPDIILELSEYIKANLAKSEDIILDTASKTAIRFTTPVIDKLLEKVGEGWTNTKRILLYEIVIWENRLVLKLYLGPGDQTYRNKLIEFFRKDTSFFKLASRTLGTKWHAVYKKEFLYKRDYENSEPDDLKAKINKKLLEFMQVDAVKINKYFQDNWKSK